MALYFLSLPTPFHTTPSATDLGNHERTQNNVELFPILKYHCGSHFKLPNPNFDKAGGRGNEAWTTDMAKVLVSIAPGA